MTYRSNLNFKPGRGNFLHPTIGQTDFLERIAKETQGQIVVNVGSGNYRPIPHAINVDFANAPEVDVVCSAYNLEFEDESVDFILCLALLEHVRYPMKVIDEFKRILKPGGKIYCEVPFMFPAHPSPEDFWRTTIEGLSTWLEDFEKIESGFSSGPSSTVSVFLHKYLSYVQPGENEDTSPFIPLIKGIIKHVDDYLIFKNKLDFDKANELACTVFFYGQKNFSIKNSTQRETEEKIKDLDYYRAKKSETYLSSYLTFKNNIRKYIQGINAQGAFAVYGTGDLCEIVLSAISSLSPVAIVDRDEKKVGTTVLGLPVISIDQIDHFNIKNIIISSFSNRNEIKNRLIDQLAGKNINLITLEL